MTADRVAVLDTDVASSLYRHRHLGRPLDTTLSAVIGQYRPLISVVTLGETRYGTARAKWSAQRAQQPLEFYRRSFTVLPIDEAVAHEYGRLRAATEAVGRPVADNDLSGSPPPPQRSPSPSSPSTVDTSSL